MRSPTVMVVGGLVVSGMLLFAAASSEAQTFGCSRYPNGAVAPAGTLRAASGQSYFTVYNTATGVTEARFLSLVSYFGAMRPGHDPTAAFSGLCATGVNGVRIFADFWQSNAYCSGGFLAESDAVIRVDGTLNPTRLARLKQILTAARTAGLVVDLSFSHEVVDGRTMSAHKQGIGRLANELNSPLYDHVMFDVQNEFDSIGCPVRVDLSPHIPDAIYKGKHGYPGLNGDPNRVVIASTSEGNHLIEQAMVVNNGGSAVTVHETRNPWAFNTPLWANLATVALSYGLHYPIYAQEPERWTAANPISANAIALAAYNAKLTGAAAWTFHTEALFFPAPGPSLGSWGTPEVEFLGVVPSSSYTLNMVLATGCWGDTAPAGWLPFCP